MSGELAGFALLLVLFVVAVVWHNRGSIRDWFNRPGISLDQWDGVIIADPEPEQDTADPCNERRPHRMLPTEYGWRCANDCGERWYVDPADELAVADLALWELENGWEVEA